MENKKASFTMIDNNFIDSEMKHLKPSTVMVYLVLFRCKNETKNGDMVFPSYTHLQEQTGLGRKCVWQALNELKEAGYITSVDKGFNRSNHYHITSSSKKKPLVDDEVVAKRNISSSKKKLEVVAKGNPNNTNLTILNNNTDLLLTFDSFRTHIRNKLNFTIPENSQKWIDIYTFMNGLTKEQFRFVISNMKDEVESRGWKVVNPSLEKWKSMLDGFSEWETIPLPEIVEKEIAPMPKTMGRNRNKQVLIDEPLVTPEELEMLEKGEKENG